MVIASYSVIELKVVSGHIFHAVEELLKHEDVGDLATYHEDVTPREFRVIFNSDEYE